MCRGFQQKEVLNIKAFHLKLSTKKPSPDSLTLHYLPRINESPLLINDCKIRPDTPAFITLHRIVSSVGRFGSRDRVVASEGVRFEVYLNDEKVLKGVFKKDESMSNAWKMEYLCESSEVMSVEVAAEGGERVDVVVVRRRKRCFSELEEIPEMEVEGDDCCCCCNYDDDDDDDDGDDDGDDDWYCGEIEREVEGVKWAVDVGIWVVCLGIGFLVTRRPRRR